MPGQVGSIWQYLGNMVTFINCLITLLLYRDVLHIKIFDEFDIHFCLTFLNFQTNSCSDDPVNAIKPQELHAWCCNLYRNVHYIKVLAEFSSQSYQRLLVGDVDKSDHIEIIVVF